MDLGQINSELHHYLHALNGYANKLAPGTWGRPRRGSAHILANFHGIRLESGSGEDVLSEGTSRTLAGPKKYLPSAKTCFQNEVR